MEKVTLTHTQAWANANLYEGNLAIATDAGFRYHLKFGPEYALWTELLTPCCSGPVGGKASGLTPRHCTRCYDPVKYTGSARAPINVSYFAGWAEPHLAHHYPIFVAALLAHDLQVLNAAIYKSWSSWGSVGDVDQLQRQLRYISATFSGQVEGKIW